MRWLTPKNRTPHNRRIFNKFLLLPLTLHGQTRWLERATVVEAWNGDGWFAWSWGLGEWKGGREVHYFTVSQRDRGDALDRSNYIPDLMPAG